MVRMTDLLKKAKKQLGGFKQKETISPSPQDLSVAPTPLPVEEQPAPPKSEPPKPEERAKRLVKFADMLLGEENKLPSATEDITDKFMKATIPDEEEAKRLYFDSLESVKKIFNAYEENSQIDEKEIMDIANKIVNNIFSGSKALLKLFHESDSLELYLYYKAINVSILSVEIGVACNYNKSQLLDLAVTGLLYDTDLIKSKDIINRPQKLGEDERVPIKEHPVRMSSFVNDTFKFTKEIVNAILKHHERKKGQGYPAGLSEAEIGDFAVILGIADSYESMIHSRPYKEKMEPHTAVLHIINTCKELFPNQFIKALVSSVGLYPVGSWVQLNTGEIGKVLEVNPEFPLKPVVCILMDEDKTKLRESRTVNLQKTPSLHIKGIVKEAT